MRRLRFKLSLFLMKLVALTGTLTVSAYLPRFSPSKLRNRDWRPVATNSTNLNGFSGLEYRWDIVVTGNVIITLYDEGVYSACISISIEEGTDCYVKNHMPLFEIAKNINKLMDALPPLINDPTTRLAIVDTLRGLSETENSEHKFWNEEDYINASNKEKKDTDTTKPRSNRRKKATPKG